MGKELRIYFENIPLYQKYQHMYAAYAAALPTCTLQGTIPRPCLWFKGQKSPNPWPYDARLFFSPQAILLEISFANEQVYQDLARFLSYIRPLTHGVIMDEAGNPVAFSQKGWAV